MCIRDRSSTDTLRDNLVIYSGDTLKITGTYNIKDTLIVNPGGYLVINNGGKINVREGGKIINNGNIITENAELKFSDGISLRNNGNLQASYTFFSALSNSWGGIYFTRNSTGTIYNCTIEKGETGGALITISQSSPNILNSTISNCYNGINILDNSLPQIFHNNIYNVEGNGIYVSNSSPYIGINEISGGGYLSDNAAVKCEYYSTPWFNDLETFSGNNTLQNGYYGIESSDHSSVYMGNSSGEYHLNRIINNTNYASADQNSVIYAILNWWGTDDPDKELFLTDENSFIYYEPYLTEDPLEGYDYGGEGNYTYLSRQLIKAIKDPGEYEVKFDGSGYASGVYIYRIQSNDQVLTKKFILMK